jgi:hypothetical protein
MLATLLISTQRIQSQEAGSSSLDGSSRLALVVELEDPKLSAYGKVA